MTWDFSAPRREELGDREVRLEAKDLLGLRVAWLITGSIAAYRCPDLIRGLRRYGAEVEVFLTPMALNFVTKDTLAWASNKQVFTWLSEVGSDHLGSAQGGYDFYLCIPSTYNSINKFAVGLADNLVGSLFASALGYLEEGKSSIIIAPCMHRSMHNNRLKKSLKMLAENGVHILKPIQEDNKNKIIELSSLIQEMIALKKKN